MTAESIIVPVELLDRLGGFVGAGSQAEVYRARRTDTHEIIALRLPFLSFDAEGRAREIQEITKRLEPFLDLDHPNLVRHLHHQTVTPRDGAAELPQYQMLMEFCTGGTLRRHVETNSLTMVLLQKWTKQLISGLSYLSEQGFVHRDIKPDNIFLSTADAENCLLKIGDIGDVTRIVGEFTHRNEMSTGKGTYEFMSPEMITGDTPASAGPGHSVTSGQPATVIEDDGDSIVGRRTDVWSLGCVVIQMITGRLPRFYKTSPNGSVVRMKELAVMYFVGTLGGSPTIPSGLPKDLQDFIEQCLIRKVKDRPCATGLQNHPFLTATDVSQWTLPEREPNS